MVLIGSPDRVSRVIFSPGGNMIASTCSAGNSDILLWSWPGGKELFRLPKNRLGIASIVFAPCGKYLAATGFFEPDRVWNLETKKIHKEFRVGKRKDGSSSLVFSPDGKVLAAAEQDGK